MGLRITGVSCSYVRVQTRMATFVKGLLALAGALASSYDVAAEIVRQGM